MDINNVRELRIEDIVGEILPLAITGIIVEAIKRLVGITPQDALSRILPILSLIVGTATSVLFNTAYGIEVIIVKGIVYGAVASGLYDQIRSAIAGVKMVK